MLKIPRNIGSLFLIVLLSLAVLPSKSFAKVINKDIYLGMSAAFTGPNKGLGIELYRGSKAYFDKINAQGGINGSKIHIKYYDDGYNPAPAIENTIKLIEKDKVLCLFNYVGTPTVTRVLPLIKYYNKNKKVLLFFPLTGAEPQRIEPYNKYSFNLRSSYNQETAALVDNLYKQGHRNISILYQADSFGRSGWYGVVAQLKKHQLRLASEATYSRGHKANSSMERQVKIISKGNPDAVIIVGGYEASTAFIRDFRDAGYTSLICNLSFSSATLIKSKLAQLSPSNTQKYTKRIINSQVVPCYNDLSLPAVREYQAVMEKYAPSPPKLKDKYKYSPKKYSSISLEGFLNAKVMTIVLRKLLSNSHSELESALTSIKGEEIGLNTKVTFTKENHQGLNSIYYTYFKENRLETLKSWDIFKK